MQHIFACSVFLLWTDCQRLTGLKWFISDVIKHDGWELEVDGLVKNPQRYSMADLRALSGSKGNEAVDQILVSQIPISLILAQVKPLKRARYVVLHYVDRIIYMDIVTAYTDSTMLVYGDIAATNIKRLELSNRRSAIRRSGITHWRIKPEQ